MRDRASATSIFASPASPRAAVRTSWGERLMLRLLGLPTPEQVEERMRNYRGFFARLTPEQLAAMDSIDPYEVLGDPNGPKRKF